MATEYVLWYYTPNVVAAIIFTVIFVALTIAHLVFRVRVGAKFCNPLIVGGIFEVIGYGARAAAHFNTTATVIYAMQSLFLLLGPILFAASTYMVLGRIIHGMGGQRLSLIPTKWLTKAFVAGDILCFAIQGAGGALLSSAKTQSRINLGNWVIIVGLLVQVVTFGFFIVCTAVYDIRSRRYAGFPASRSSSVWYRVLSSIYAVSALIMVRNIYRIIEYATGRDGYVQTNEWVLYIFDAFLMVMVMSICFLWYNSSLKQNADPVEGEMKEQVV